MSIQNDSLMPKSTSADSIPPSPTVGKDTNDRSITINSNIQTRAHKVATQLKLQSAAAQIGQLNVSDQTNAKTRYEQTSAQYNQKSALGKFASRVAGHFTENVYTQKKDALAKLQASIEGYIFKSSSSKDPNDYAADKETARNWLEDSKKYPPKDQAKIIHAVNNKIAECEGKKEMKDVLTNFVARQEVRENQELQKYLKK
ncbi:MAG: hypothetical protein LBE99_01665 [Puniceicoccales bacterium]|jgi:hypothetical protein|nr:hypothetical protein [Puniceicoccales bacterium]